VRVDSSRLVSSKTCVEVGASKRNKGSNRHVEAQGYSIALPGKDEFLREPEHRFSRRIRYERKPSIGKSPVSNIPQKFQERNR